MVEFDPSSRSSKRRRTGTYATRRTTLTATETDSTKIDDHEEVPGDEPISDTSLTNMHEEPQTTTTPTESSPPPTKDAGNAEQTTRGKKKGSARKPPQRQFEDSIEAAAARQSPEEADDGDEQEQEAETPRQAVDTTNIQTRSSGRTRRAPKRFDVGEEAASVDNTATKGSRHAKTGSRKASPALLPHSVQSPLPKGILTPSRKGRRTGPRKSVVFDGDQGDKGIEEQLGFKDINTTSSKQKGTRAATNGTIVEQEKLAGVAATEKEEVERATTPIDVDTDDDLLVDPTPNVDEILLQPAGFANTANDEEVPTSTVEDDPHVIKIKSEILNRLTNNLLSPIAHLEKEYSALHTLLSATITAGESNSLLLLGSRGSGKSTLVKHALQDLTRKHANDFHIVRLNGFFQTDDKLALREIWRQLGREMALSEDETGEVSSYADTMTSLLGLLSHPEEFDNVAADAMQVEDVSQSQDVDRKTSKSVVFVLDEFDLFTFHPRQTLLYNLFDIAQAKKAPIAVVGCSTRMDVVDLLEKRVKSRFSHRWLHVAAMKSLVAFEEAVCGILSLSIDGSEALGLSISELEWRGRWNAFIKGHFLSTTSIQSLVKKTFYTTKSIPDLLRALYIPIATLNLGGDERDGNTLKKNDKSVTLSTQPSLLALLPQLPTLHLALLVAGTRLETIHNLTAVNFALAYSHYSELLARSKLQRSAYSTLGSGGAFTGAGMRLWSKDTARGAWEDLAAWDAIVPVGGLGGNSTSVGKLGDEGLGSEGAGSRMFRLDITIDEMAWAIKQKLGTTGIGDMLTRWCKEV